METDIVALFVPIVSVTVIGLVLVAFFFFRHKSRAQLQQTVRDALEKGSELTPELIDRLAGPKGGPDRDLRRALIFIAVGIATAMFGFIVDDPDALRAMAAISSFPILIGVAYLAMWKFTDRGDKADS